MTPDYNTSTQSIFDGYGLLLAMILFFLLTFELWVFLFVGAFNALLREKKRSLYIQSLELENKRLRGRLEAEQEGEYITYQDTGKDWEETDIDEGYEIDREIEYIA